MLLEFLKISQVMPEISGLVPSKIDSLDESMLRNLDPDEGPVVLDTVVITVITLNQLFK